MIFLILQDMIRFDGPHFYMTLEKFNQLHEPELSETISEIRGIRIYCTEKKE